MKEMAATDARNRFGELLDIAQTGPVRLTNKGRAVGVVMSVRQYERLRGAAYDGLAETMDAISAEAAANGLTDADLQALLTDAD
ncbi:MAG: type II toxin-antitoxin system Phd/YefM family antitoxin [Myxococcota bacterium]